MHFLADHVEEVVVGEVQRTRELFGEPERERDQLVATHSVTDGTVEDAVGREGVGPRRAVALVSGVVCRPSTDR